MQLLNNKDTDWKQENNRRNQPWNLITSSDPQTGYSCLQELGLRLFIMTLCHFSFSKSNGISEKQRQNRHNSNWLQEECEKVPSSTRLKKSCSQFVRLPRAPEVGVCIVSHSQTASTRRWRVTVAIFGWTFTSPSDCLVSPQLPPFSPSFRDTELEEQLLTTAKVNPLAMLQKWNASFSFRKVPSSEQLE